MFRTTKLRATLVKLAFAGLLPIVTCSSATAQNCSAFAGTMTAYKDVECFPYDLIGGIAHGNAVVPAGFQSTYVLTENATLSIIGIGNSTIFQISSVGTYSVHTLVYEPNTLDLNAVQLGVTTAFDLEALLIQGGGTICGSLDMVGAPTVVVDPQAGTMNTFTPFACRVGGIALLEAMANGDANIPSGYAQLFVLSQGAAHIIIAVDQAPNFTVSDTGQYAIHSMVYDVLMAPLASIQIGVSTANDLFALFGTGGGPMCGMLDLAGAPLKVGDCMTSCDADAGTLSSLTPDTLCLSSSMLFSAQPDGNAVIPIGYEVIYVLTAGTGLVVQSINFVPTFSLVDTGHYTIHTLVYELNTLPLSGIQPGVTTGFDIYAQLLQGGGVICGSLDVGGAQVYVQNCPMPCPAQAGSLLAIGDGVCPWENVEAIPSGQVIPAGFAQVFLLTTEPNQVLFALNALPVFQPMLPDTYNIHTLVYDPNTLDLNLLQVGTTSLHDIDALLLQGGGGICGALDLVGATIRMTPCDILDQGRKLEHGIEVSLSPNPVISELQVVLQAPIQGQVIVQLVDGLGRVRISKPTALNGSGSLVQLNTTALEQGTYLLRVLSGKEVIHGQVVSKEE